MEPKDIEAIVKKAMLSTKAPMFKAWDGNGGHRFDWIKIFGTVISFLLGLVIVTMAQAAFSRYWSNQDILKAMNDLTVQVTGIRTDLNDISFPLNDAQSDRINDLTREMWKKWPGVPCPPPIPSVKEMKQRR